MQKTIFPIAAPTTTKAMHYLQRLATAMQRLDLKPGTIATVHVQHDAGCPLLAGKSKCRCTPAIFIETLGGKIEVTPDGSILSTAELN